MQPMARWFEGTQALGLEPIHGYQRAHQQNTTLSFVHSHEEVHLLQIEPANTYIHIDQIKYMSWLLHQQYCIARNTLLYIGRLDTLADANPHASGQITIRTLVRQRPDA